MAHTRSSTASPAPGQEPRSGPWARGEAAPGPTPGRRLGPQQFAFARAWAEGIDPAVAWERFLYLDGCGDVRRARGELQRILEELKRIARLNGRPDLAALLCRDPEAIVDPRSSGLPSLDEFRSRFDADFYSEAELLALYQQTHEPAAQARPVGGAVPGASARRRQRLRARLVEAIQWLHDKATRPPRPEDALTLWLDARVAARLAAVGLRSVADLRFWIAQRGFHWHRKVPRLGPRGAERIVRWLQEHPTSLGTLPGRALAPLDRQTLEGQAPAPLTAIVPFERFAPPSDHRSGREGSNRAPRGRCKLSAEHDHEAVEAWLRLRQPGSHTWRAYRKEAERFLLWAVIERGKAMSSLAGDDCGAYREFLARPGVQWVGPRNGPRWSEAWRPFEGPLGPRSQAVALAIVRSLCGWLVRQRYLESNPWDDVPQRPTASTTPAAPGLRALNPQQWALMLGWLDGEAGPPSPALARLRFLIRFGYFSGMRLAELAAARLEWLHHAPLNDGEPAWSIRVPGKRDRWREVPLADGAMQALADYLVQRGLHPDLTRNDPQAPLVARLAQEAALSPARIYAILRDGFERCAASVYRQDRQAAERIRQASTHWLRHTHGSHAVALGVPQDVLQANLGHASLATTSIYAHAEQGRRHRAVQAAFKAAR